MQFKIAKLSAQYVAHVRVKSGLSITVPCPECGSKGPHDTNGDRLDPTTLCAKPSCGYQWEVKPQ